MRKIVESKDIALGQFNEAETLEQRRTSIAAFLADMGINRTMKVLIGTNSLECGGQEHQVLRLIPELKKLGLEVEHMYYSGPHTLAAKYKDRNIKSTLIDKNKLGRWRCWKRLIEHIAANRFDVVHAFGGTANVYVRGAAVLAGTRVILGGGRDRTGPCGFLSVAVNSVLNLFTPAWVINSRTNEEGLRKLKFMKGKRLYVLPNGLDDYDESLPPAAVAPELINWIGSRLIVAAVGRICEVKNYDLFLDAAKRVHPIFPDSCFLIIGGPDCRDEGLLFEKRLSSRVDQERLSSFVRMVGNVENMDRWYPRIDVLVSTSRFEGCPNVVLEAMCASRPIVMTNSCDTSQMIKEGQNGFVVDVDDVNSLTEKVVLLLRSQEMREDFGRLSRQIVRDAFSTTQSAWALAKIYLKELYLSMPPALDLKQA